MKINEIINTKTVTTYSERLELEPERMKELSNQMARGAAKFFSTLRDGMMHSFDQVIAVGVNIGNLDNVRKLSKIVASPVEFVSVCYADVEVETMKELAYVILYGEHQRSEIMEQMPPEMKMALAMAQMMDKSSKKTDEHKQDDLLEQVKNMLKNKDSKN